MTSLSQARAGLDAVAGRDRANVMCRRELALALRELAAAHRSCGDVAQSTEASRESLALCEKLEQSDPANTQWQVDCAASCLQFATIMLDDKKDMERAMQFALKALLVLERLADAGHLDAEGRRLVGMAVHIRAIAST